MIELTQVIPDVNVLLALEPEELGAKILFLLLKRNLPRNMFHPGNLNGEIWPQVFYPGQQTAYPPNRRDDVEIALTEAWAWLESQGLIVPAPDTNGRNGWRILSRRARRFASEAEFVRYIAARFLQKDALHPRMADKVWLAFMRGEFDVAVFQAMKTVEVSVRDAAGLGNNLVGVPLMREAFAVDRGPLTDTASERGEQVARMELFAGAIGSYKNPHSHRDVDLDDPVEAAELIMLANHLLRIADVRAAARPSP
ncbi:MAG TPA: TIGR02391 family protein [Candidatus Angelobacter sp.]|nr:TIGR02391 family protein [Candidatus Angelobacter sp.]